MGRFDFQADTESSLLGDLWVKHDTIQFLLLKPGHLPGFFIGLMIEWQIVP